MGDLCKLFLRFPTFCFGVRGISETRLECTLRKLFPVAGKKPFLCRYPFFLLQLQTLNILPLFVLCTVQCTILSRFFSKGSFTVRNCTHHFVIQDNVMFSFIIFQARPYNPMHYHAKIPEEVMTLPLDGA